MRLTTQVTTLTSRGAEVALKAAIDEAERMNIRLCVAVVDRAGHLLAFRRMDGAPPPSIDVATAKAQTAALFGVPSKTFQTMVNEGQAAILAVRTLAPLEGGVPIAVRSEEHTSELQSLMRSSYAVFCLKKKTEEKPPK